jgi:hypothetical protein
MTLWIVFGIAVWFVASLPLGVALGRMFAARDDLPLAVSMSAPRAAERALSA